MALIVLEGVDGAGKSTLAEAIAGKLHDAEVRHAGPLDSHPLSAYALAFEDYAPGTGRHVVCDRLHWGELIYGPLYRGGSRLTEPMFRWTELYLRARGAVAFHVTQDLEVIQARLRLRGEDYLESHHVEQVWREFGEVADRSLLRVGDVRPGLDEIDRMAERIVQAAIYYDSQAAHIYSRFPGYVGHATPGALLVGDKRGGQPPYETRAAFMPRAGNSGAYLMSALGPPSQAWPGWRGVGLVNALDEEIDLRELVADLGEPIVVALGRNAHEELDRQGIEHGAVPHPQYIRRFFNKRAAEYGGIIAQAINTGEQHISWPK